MNMVWTKDKKQTTKKPCVLVTQVEGTGICKNSIPKEYYQENKTERIKNHKRNIQKVE